MFWLIGGVIMAAVVTVMFLRGARSSTRLSSLGPVLRAPLHRNTAIFFGPAVVRDNVLEPSLLTNEQTFYSLTVVGSAGLIAMRWRSTLPSTPTTTPASTSTFSGPRRERRTSRTAPTSLRR
jgi:hypothetical protein